MNHSILNRTVLRFAAIITMPIFVVSCSGNSWTSDQQETFLNECSAEGGAGSYCKCYLEKVMEKYPNHADSKNLDFESAVEMAKSCE